MEIYIYISTYLRFYLRQVVDILKMSGNDELFSPEMDVIKYRDSDPGLDLLGALLAVSQPPRLIYLVVPQF